MKNLCFFITHKTLSYDHARMTFESIFNQQTDKKFDKLYIYNSHSDELSNKDLLDLYSDYNLNRLFDDVVIFNYNPSTHKSLGADVYSINSYLINHYQGNDRVLLLKSDCVLSKNYFDTILNISEHDIIFFTAPFVCAKERIQNDEIKEYSLRDKFVSSDEKTFMVEDHTGFYVDELKNGRSDNLSVTSPEINFTSCYVLTDFSCHFYSIDMNKYFDISYHSWGGVKFYNIPKSYIRITDRCFVIHKYHDIISSNRAIHREGPVEDWLRS